MSIEPVAALSIRDFARSAREASYVAATLSSTTKNTLLREFARTLDQNREVLSSANLKDVEQAERNGIHGAMLDRLRLSDKVISGMVASLQEVADQADPVGEMIGLSRRPNGMLVGRMRIPLGVIGIIYESRPNVTSDAAGLCLKAGNACILRGGSEAFHSNQAIGKLFQAVLRQQGLPPALVTVIPTPDREVLLELLTLEDDIDLIIPRGGESLIRFVAQHSRIPVIKHYRGVCHTFVDASADTKMAVDLICNGKAQRPGVCNSTETLLVHKDAVQTCLKPMIHSLVNLGVEIRGCDQTLNAFKDEPSLEGKLKAAQPDDFGREFLDFILAVKVVDSFEAAVAHIQRFGSNHTETIVTENHAQAMRFIREVNSSTVMVNASTRFADGFQLGLGAEIGISTTKLHAYGPMGAEGLTTLKFVVLGDGQIRTS